MVNYFCHQQHTDYLLKARVMLPKQKRRRLDGQQMIAFGPSGLQLEKPSTETGESLRSSPPTDTSECSRSNPPNSHCGSIESWQSFAQPKYAKKYPRLVLKPDGIYCHYCSALQPCMQSSTTVFITSPFTGSRSDKLLQHKRCGAHVQSSLRYHESTTACN